MDLFEQPLADALGNAAGHEPNPEQEAVTSLACPTGKSTSTLARPRTCQSLVATAPVMGKPRSSRKRTTATKTNDFDPHLQNLLV
jgi:hypothetical protein